MSELSLEKQFLHTMFCQQLNDLEVETARKLLADLHLLYLGQQSLFAELIKQDTLREFKTT